MENPWISTLYKSVRKEHSRLGLKDGMAIFYTPVIYEPEILFIGDNPGGSNGIIWTKPPEQHDYFLDQENDYPFARKMRFILSGQILENLLRSSVKINRVFFQSKTITDLNHQVNWKDLQSFCLPFVNEIIQTLNPRVIIAESVGSFNALIKHLGGNFTEEYKLESDGKILIRSGRINDRLIIGLQHPTSSRGITNKHWAMVRNKLTTILK